MADVASTLRAWSATPGNNSPSGLTLIGANLDDNLREMQAVVRKYLASTASNMTAGSTVDLSTADGYYINITGTTTITAFGTESAGIHYVLKFASALTLTHNATSLILPGGANIKTAAGDIALMISEGSGNWRCISYQRASGSTIAYVSVKDFGATGDGVTNDATAIQAAMDALTSGGTLYFPQGTYLCGSQITHKANIECVGLGRATIKKGFNGDLWSIAVSGAEVRGFQFDGQHGTYTGKGISCSGSCFRPVIKDTYFTSFTDSHIEFAADKGQGAVIDGCYFNYGSGQTDYRAIFVNGPDTTAMFRSVSNCTSVYGYVDLNGALDFYVTNSTFKRVETDSSCSQVFITGVRWANANAAMTIYGATHVANCSFAGAVTLNSSFSGNFVGNAQTSPGFTNSSTGAGHILHYDTSTAEYLWGNLSAYTATGGIERITTSRVANIASSDITLTVGGSARVVQITGALTAAMAVTLSTTGAINGDRFRIVRAATATGAFNVNVGTGPLKAMSVAGSWCDVEYNGSQWYLTGYGTL